MSGRKSQVLKHLRKLSTPQAILAEAEDLVVALDKITNRVAILRAAMGRLERDRWKPCD